MEVSVRAAAAEIIAADFYAAPTDSLLPKKFGSSCRQQGSAPIVWRRPYAEHDMFQFDHFR